ncbi:MAG: hypothetical protein WDN72_05310 [Alphaproteobacteria bacterium]
MLVERVIAYLRTLRDVTVTPFEVVREHVAFNLPAEVRHRPFTERLRKSASA